ncbi:hypothetical protein ZIOFF_030765 [Zingiber officinale]|uniref:YqaJ viral recombinase domain-containing protein n=2 Tax=Zingiber officinale TaxID=94328 RepID=A0A8J5H9R1_ZINOF|nr:hypothetical protein ZIOFF_030765 [Zingiber officinale]
MLSVLLPDARRQTPDAPNLSSAISPAAKDGDECCRLKVTAATFPVQAQLFGGRGRIGGDSEIPYILYSGSGVPVPSHPSASFEELLLELSILSGRGRYSWMVAFPRQVHVSLITLQPNPIARFHRQVISSMTSPCYAHAKFLPSKRNYEGYIPTTCTASSLLLSRQSSPVTHKISLGLGVSAQFTYDAPQRSEEWFTLRREKLTTSAFSTALGFWKGKRRSELWYQKVFAEEVDTMEASAKAAMEWGVFNEPTAIKQYKSITGRDVSSLGFAVHTEATLGWLGASPDGLLGLYPDGGILEVKCPYNKGMPKSALPWKIMPHYYMPQVQGQMEVMDREWVDLYCWTPNGSSLFRVYRDRAYFKLMHKILYEFWWGNVMPARQALLMGSEVDARLYEPTPKHQLTSLVVSESKKLAVAAKLLCTDIGGRVEFFR